MRWSGFVVGGNKVKKVIGVGFNMNISRYPWRAPRRTRGVFDTRELSLRRVGERFDQKVSRSSISLFIFSTYLDDGQCDRFFEPGDLFFERLGVQVRVLILDVFFQIGWYR